MTICNFRLFPVLVLSARLGFLIASVPGLCIRFSFVIEIIDITELMM